MTRVALRTGAPLGRRVSCALVEPSEVRMDAAEVQRVLVEPGLTLPRIAVAVVRGEGIGGGELLLLPSGESAWLPAEALVEADEPNSCCVMRPVDALAVRISACWLACEPPDDPAWTVDRFDAEYVYLQLEGGGSLFRALPETSMVSTARSRGVTSPRRRPSTLPSLRRLRRHGRRSSSVCSATAPMACRFAAPSGGPPTFRVRTSSPGSSTPPTPPTPPTSPAPRRRSPSQLPARRRSDRSRRRSAGSSSTATV